MKERKMIYNTWFEPKLWLPNDECRGAVGSNCE